uniref:hypothetical protein n=1 Tax=Exserohilum turcicum TaxID=93612 RepID=UPI0020018EFA|nr:hypothetical protein M1I11_mgp173 [Exserohilum turcicum]UOU81310.1 hypothetical protein [Exserohilum turcicum]
MSLKGRKFIAANVKKKYFYYSAPFRVRFDYILSLRQPTSSRWTAHHNLKRLCCLAADYPFPFVHKFRFYHTTSHYLCHKMCYHSCLVEISLGISRQFDGL